MAFQTPITAKSALEAVQRHDYALPAIQREFVWSTDQICMLFDSLLRGYPIGSFLFWKVKAENSQKFVFYDFIRAYHQRNSPHCQALALAAPRDLTAILDGQQRLTDAQHWSLWKPRREAATQALEQRRRVPSQGAISRPEPRS